MGHIPDWLDGSLTTPKYIGQALLSAARNATKNASTYGMFASREAPANPEDAIWEDISYEKAAAERSKRWLKAWEASGGRKIGEGSILLSLCLLTACSDEEYANKSDEEIRAEAVKLPLEQRYEFYIKGAGKFERTAE